MKQHGDCCPKGCGVIATPATWTNTSTGGRGDYTCPICRHEWSTYYSAHIDDVEFSA